MCREYVKSGTKTGNNSLNKSFVLDSQHLKNLASPGCLFFNVIVRNWNEKLFWKPLIKKKRTDLQD